MRLFRRSIFILLLILFCLPMVLCSQAPTTARLLRVSDGRILSLADMVKDLSKCRLVFVGEVHTNQNDHRAQLEIIRALKNAGAPVVIGLEMFRRDSQSALDRWVKGKLSEKEFEKIYYKNWNYPWSLYKEIFLYAGEHKIPMVGLNIPPQVTRQVAREGFDSLTAKQRGGLPMVTCRVDPEYMAFIRRSLAMHGHGGLDFTRFCEAQLVWDTTMALSLLPILRRTRNPRWWFLLAVDMLGSKGYRRKFKVEQTCPSASFFQRLQAEWNRETSQKMRLTTFGLD